MNMKKLNIESAVGMFLVAGFLCFAYLAVRLGDIQILGSGSYPVKARFTSVSGLKTGARIEIAGVVIGKVKEIRLDDYQAEVEMQIDSGVQLQEDSIASIRTQGIIGDKYIKISPGAMDETIPAEGEILETEGAISLEDLISKYIFEKE
jgi:phospholipid/cholesterol/gamma-HCH transport system substrate-binding protein